MEGLAWRAPLKILLSHLIQPRSGRHCRVPLLRELLKVNQLRAVTWQAGRASAVGSAVSIQQQSVHHRKPRAEKPGALRGSKLTLRPFHAFDIITPTPRITPHGIFHPTTTDNNSRWRKLLPSDSELLDDPTTPSSDCAHCGRPPQNPIACRHDALLFVVRFRNPRLTALFLSPTAAASSTPRTASLRSSASTSRPTRTTPASGRL